MPPFSGLAFQEFQEGRIKFKPTYKFDVGTDNYDSSNKLRIPSYTVSDTAIVLYVCIIVYALRVTHSVFRSLLDKCNVNVQYIYLILKYQELNYPIYEHKSINYWHVNQLYYYQKVMNSIVKMWVK